MTYLVIGLGNVGAEYIATRHNVGFMVLDRLAQDKGLIFSNEKFGSKTVLKYKGRIIHLIKPNTFMNCSGQCVSYWKNKLMLPIENILIVVDDIALPLGRLRIKPHGSHAGHNGLLDIESLLNTSKYPRLRIGIGNDFSKGRQTDYVLGKFQQIEMETLGAIIGRSCEAILSFCSEGIVSSMNRYN